MEMLRSNDDDDGVELVYRRHGRPVSVWTPARGLDPYELAAEMVTERRAWILVHRDGIVTKYAQRGMKK